MNEFQNLNGCPTAFSDQSVEWWQRIQGRPAAAATARAGNAPVQPDDELASIRANVQNHFKLECRLIHPVIYKIRHLAALGEWQLLIA